MANAPAPCHNRPSDDEAVGRSPSGDMTHNGSSGFSKGGSIGSRPSKWAQITLKQYKAWRSVQISEGEGVEGCVEDEEDAGVADSDMVDEGPVVGIPCAHSSLH